MVPGWYMLVAMGMMLVAFVLGACFTSTPVAKKDGE